MSTQGSNDDCYFYFYSSCTKGDDCPFRHCQTALGTETVCFLWRQGRCFRDNCKFRHMESHINRGNIQCYWEDQSSGCLKPHCVFKHWKPRRNIHPISGKESLILPTSTATSQASPSIKVAEIKESPSNPVKIYSSNNNDSEMCPASIPIEPIIFSIDSEESDSESVSSTPVKSISYDTKCNSVTVKKDLSVTFTKKNEDFGIKTLEQIKLEKIYKEVDVFMPKIYPPSSFKSRILKRKNVPVYSTLEKSVPPQKVACLEKGKDNDNIDFKIKTLDEIRKEKKNKSASEEVYNESTVQSMSTVNDNSHQSSSSSTKKQSASVNGRRLKIKRQPNESLSNISILQEADSSSDCQKKEQNQMVLREVQNISYDQIKANSKGKRKVSQPNSADIRSPKQLKADDLSLSKRAATAAESEERQVTSSRPIIKRKRSTSSVLQTTVLPSKEASSTVVKQSEPVLQKSERLHSENNNCPKEINCDSGVSNSEEKIPETSLDEIDNFLMNETDVTLDYEPDGAINESDDILLQIDQLLKS